MTENWGQFGTLLLSTDAGHHVRARMQSHLELCATIPVLEFGQGREAHGWSSVSDRRHLDRSNTGWGSPRANLEVKRIDGVIPEPITRSFHVK